METKANYILIGLFTIAGLLGILGFFLWFARVELDQQFDYYDIRFSSVSGLSAASDVRFSGLPVGQVVDVRLSETRDGTITVRVEVDAETPVRDDSVATIESQGVTGVSYVSIGPGSPDAPLLDPAPGEVPVLEAGRSTLQSLTEDAPELINETLRVVQEIGDLFRGENEGRLERILLNAEEASGDFADAVAGFSDIAGTVDEFTGQIERFNTTLDTLTAEFTTVLATANESLASIDLLADQATAVVASGTDTLDMIQGVAGEAERFISGDLAEATADLRGLLVTLEGEATTLRSDASALMAALGDEAAALRSDAGTLMETLGTTGATATARLQEAEDTLARLDALIASLDTTSVAVGDAATRIDGLLEEEGAPLLSETRAAVAAATETIATINTAAETDLPAVMADLRAAAETARSTIETVGADLSTASGDVSDLVDEAEAALVQVTDTFANANTTLAAINGALETGETTLTAAERAFSGAGDLIEGDIAVLMGDLRGTVERLDATIGTVSEDIPAISADLRAASQAASDAFATLEGLIDDAAPGVAEFTTSALPLYTRLAQETRTLISNLESLTQRISRNPTQFFLDRNVPEFRR